MGRTLGFVALAFAAWIAVTGPAPAQGQDKAEISPAELEKIRQSNAKCLDCHAEGHLQEVTRSDVDREKLAGLLVDASIFAESNHGNVECVACHVTGFAEFPHAEDDKRQINLCDECHTRLFLRIEDQFFKSVHAKKAEEKPGSFTCVTCHDPHVFRQATHFSTTREAVRQDNDMCLQCHASDTRFAQISADKRPDLDEIHDWLPNTPLHWAAVRCVECHTPEPKKVLSHEILPAEKAEKNCVACHSVNSALRVRLYRHLVDEEREKAGFVNSVILNEAYVIGATRNRYLDLFFAIAAVAITAGFGLHALVRFAAAIRRRNRRG